MDRVPRDPPHGPLRQVFRQGVDGNDAADVEGFLDIIPRHLELGVHKDGLALVAADLAEDDQRVTNLELVRQVLRVEPPAADHAGAVLENGFIERLSKTRPHEAAGDKRSLDRGRLATLQGGDFLEMAAIVVPPRQGEKQIADGFDVEPLELFGADLPHALQVADGRGKSLGIFRVGHDGEKTDGNRRERKVGSAGGITRICFSIDPSASG